VLGLIAAGGLVYVGVERERPMLFAFAAAVLAVWLVIALRRPLRLRRGGLKARRTML